jgi:hypothetical protein
LYNKRKSPRHGVEEYNGIYEDFFPYSFAATVSRKATVEINLKKCEFK